MIKIIRKLFEAIDNIIIRVNGLTFIPESTLQYFYIDIQKYKGKDIYLSDGSTISKNDKIIELHINNKKTDNIKKGELKKIRQIINSEMKLLTSLISNNNDLKDIKAIYGRTVLYPLIAKKGFDVLNIEKKGLRFFLAFWDNIIKTVYSNYSSKFKKREPKEIWISSKKLQEKFE
jgi:hypothetical protein